MSISTVFRFVLLSALWGASYVFIRVGAIEFGALALAAMRAVLAALALLPVLRHRHGFAALKENWQAIALVGLSNCAAPYLLFGLAERHIPAGMSSIFTAATPVYSSFIAWAWLRERPSPGRIAGLALGLGGVLLLVKAQAAGPTDAAGAPRFWAALACVAATVSYAFSGNFTRRFLARVPPLAVATGCQISSAILLAPGIVLDWPDRSPSPGAWGALAALALFSTALAYVLFFQLIAELGPAGAAAPLFLIPPFGVFWGWLLLDEQISPAMVASVGVILAGTALATGVARFKPSCGLADGSRYPHR
jgi:drug/metabolite transporter (DMT)-like permease